LRSIRFQYDGSARPGPAPAEGEHGKVAQRGRDFVQWEEKERETMSQDQHPAMTSSREALRQQHGVRVVSASEEGVDAAALPPGVYGFTGAPAAREMPLYATPIFRGTEVHKTAGGEICLLGYVTAQEAAAIEQGAEPLVVDLYPDPYEQAQALISVPLARVDHRKPPTRVQGNSMRTEISPLAGRLAQTRLD
jgi:hypothetical protein